MKFNINLNQVKMIENNLNVNQWCILDVISIAPTWCEAISIDNEVYYWIARQKIAEEVLALDLKPDTIYRHLKNLTELGFLEHIKQGKKDLVRLSKKGKSLFSTMSEIDSNNYVGNRFKNNSETNPTYNTTNTNNITDKDEEKRFENIWKYYNIPAKSKGLKSKALSSFINKKVCKHSGEDIKIVLDAELKKEVGKRHLVTIFNNFDDSLEMANDILKEDKKKSSSSHDAWK